MRTLLLFASVLFLSTKISAQDLTKNKQEQKKEATAKVEETASVPTTTITPGPYKGDGAIPTPEEQGYTKQVINGKEVYVKESGQMILYYEPKK